jgi:hypothetical protein
MLLHCPSCQKFVKERPIVLYYLVCLKMPCHCVILQFVTTLCYSLQIVKNFMLFEEAGNKKGQWFILPGLPKPLCTQLYD